MSASNEWGAPGQWVRLNLLFSPALEDAVVEALMTDPTLPGFTLLHAQGHTSDFARASIREQVRGRVERRVLWMVIQAERVEGVLALLGGRITSTELRWWSEAVIAGGKLA